MDLPEALAPWAGQLSIFPRDLALSFGPLLQRLSPAIGPLDPHRHGALGEMDGFDGLTHRGSYERLLMSEWLLADELPDEFLRRAAAMEHTFLRPARPEPGGSRVSVAVFDAGPAQLGSPRIAHLAALLVLHRRASAAGVRFAWGVLQRPEDPLSADVDGASVLRLLAARGAEEATEANLLAWRKRVGEWRDLDDFWVVGSGRLVASAPARGASWLVVRDVLDLSRRSVAGRVHRQGTVGAEVVLDLPAERQCARLLRDPFSAVVAPTRRTAPLVAPTSNLVFSEDGVKLFARAVGSGLVQWPVPNSPREPVGPPKILLTHLSRPILAVGRLRKLLVAVTARDAELEFHQAGRGRASQRLHMTVGPMAMALPVEPGPLGPFLRFVARPSDQGGFGYLLLAAGRALIFVADEGAPRFALSAASAVALASVPDGVAYVRAKGPGQGWQAVAERSGGQVVADVSNQESPAAYFGFGGAAAHADFGLLAVSHDTNSFHVWHARGSSRLVAPVGMRVAGVVLNPRRREPGLVAIDEDGRTLLLVGQTWTRPLQKAITEIRHVAVSPTVPVIAYSTVHGELVIFSLENDVVLYRSAVEVIAEND
jgi:hypothetical protein